MRRNTAWIYLLYAAAVVAARGPGMLFVELNWDESLYWTIAGELLHGHAPYTATWDRKPPGLFALLALLQAAAGDSISVLRLGTMAAVLASALLLRAIGRILLPGLPWAATAAGLIYIAASPLNGGEGTNAELLLAPFALGGMVLALSAQANGRLHRAVASGVLFGAALLIKPVALAEGAAVATMLAVLPALRGERQRLAGLARLGLAMAAGTALPVLAVAAWYAAIGAFALLAGTLMAAGEAGLVHFSAYGLAQGTRTYAPLIGAALLGILALAFSRQRTAAAALAIWLVSVAAMLALLARFANHMFLQLLPPLSLATAGLLALGAASLPRFLSGWPRTAALVLALAAIFAWGAGGFIDAGLESAWRRAVAGQPFWGDRTATVAAALRSRIEGPGDLLVVGRNLGLYRATGTVAQTRYPFSMHLWESYAPVDGPAEIGRLLALRPRFAVVDDLWLPGGPRTGAAQERVLGYLAAALAHDFVPDGHAGRFVSWRGGFVGGGVGVTVFRRRDVPPYRPNGSRLGYDPAPAGG